jgi:hypothetical protein
MKLVTKYPISAINSCWEKCDEKLAYICSMCITINKVVKQEVGLRWVQKRAYMFNATKNILDGRTGVKQYTPLPRSGGIIRNSSWTNCKYSYLMDRTQVLFSFNFFSLFSSPCQRQCELITNRSSSILFLRHWWFWSYVPWKCEIFDNLKFQTNNFSLKRNNYTPATPRSGVYCFTSLWPNIRFLSSIVAQKNATKN